MEAMEQTVDNRLKEEVSKLTILQRKEICEYFDLVKTLLYDIEVSGYTSDDVFLFTKSQKEVFADLDKVINILEELEENIKYLNSTGLVWAYIHAIVLEITEIENSGYTDHNNPIRFCKCREQVFTEIDEAVNKLQIFIKACEPEQTESD